MLTDIRIALRRLLRAPAKVRESYSRVTAADVKAFARTYLIPGNRTVVRLLPGSTQ